ncbi:MAG: putative membrane-associated Zn-dependent proteases 1 [halophilic archaeon J07HX5]|nr:MAG: putative membrane-associated Zn-dependent proteases 1 [halophilic archaeon J07HX5]
MADPLTWVLVGIVVYTVLALALKRRGSLPESVSLSGPLTTIRTQRGQAAIDRLAQYKRFWRAWGNIGVGIAVVVMVGFGIVIVTGVITIINQPEAQTIENPQNVLVIPGVNDFLPLSAAGEILFGLLVGLVVHEGGHGLLFRVEDIELKSLGVLSLAFIPLGAFAEPDPEDQQSVDRGARARAFAAGITNNFAVTVVALVLLVPVAGAIAVAPGAPVGDTVSGSGADGILSHGDRITAVGGTPVENGTELEATVENSSAATLTVDRADASTVTVDRSLLIVGSVAGVADEIVGEAPLTTVTAVDGTAVNTKTGFASAVRAADDPVVSVETASRGTESLPVGALITAVDDTGPLATQVGDELPERPFVITALDGERTVTAEELRNVLDARGANADVTVTITTLAGATDEYAAALDGNGLLGVEVQDGFAGILFDDFGVDPYPAEEFLSLLDGSAVDSDVPPVASIVLYMGRLVVLPFATVIDPNIAYNFAGFTADLTGFFVVEGPLAFAGGFTMLAANLLFWTWWVNFNLAVFNCIPALPLDGGHILRSSVASVVSRLPVNSGRTIVTAFTLLVTIGMLGALAVSIFAPAVV